jgi:hypothetical protein
VGISVNKDWYSFKVKFISFYRKKNF